MHHHVDDRHLVERGLSNYWGYNTLAFFAPDMRFKSRDRYGDALREFKTMVRNLHAAGLEVILDVVYNHTAEGNHLGPTLSFRGIDNAAYYRLSPENKRYYTDFTGCGNTLNMLNPRVLQLIMDSLRYWVLDMHVDGFRFDLASTLARELHEVDKLGAFFDIVHQDPVLSQVKLIAEPWDLGEGGYQVGNFPVGWSEWNGKYRDCVRHFWKGDGGIISEFATRICGSSDLYAWSSRRPHASINFVTCHDGFTLHDLVSYDGKHNEANGEENRDGANDNISWNCGAEGPTDDPAIRAVARAQETQFSGDAHALAGNSHAAGRRRTGAHAARQQQRLLPGQRDQLVELGPLDGTGGRSWTLPSVSSPSGGGSPCSSSAGSFTVARSTARRSRTSCGSNPPAKRCLRRPGTPVTRAALGLFLRGDNIDIDEYGATISGDTLLVLFNADHALDLSFTLPKLDKTQYWELVFDTYIPEWGARKSWRRGRIYPLRACSLAVFRAVPIARNGGGRQP